MKHLNNYQRKSNFEKLFSESNKIYMAVSYIRDSGIKIIRPFYNQPNKEIRVLLDTKMNISEKSALQILFNDGVELKTYLGKENYHPKLFLFHCDNKWKAIIGSMNLTRGGLNSNIEYGIQLNTELDESKEWFDEFWNNNQSKTIDQDFIDNMPTIIKTSIPRHVFIKKLKNQVKTTQNTNGKIKEFITSWATDSEKKGQWQRKRGWGFRPAHGAIDQNKLIEFKEILANNSNGNIILTNNYCENIFKKYNSSRRKKHNTSPIDLFVRTYKNYLSKLNLIEYKKREKVLTITILGKQFINSKEGELKNFLIRTLTEYEWFGVNIKDYLFDIIDLTDEKLFKDEVNLFLKHSGIKDYPQNTPEDIAQLILEYRSLENKEKVEINQFAKDEFNNSDKSKSKSAWNNMANNGLNDLIKDLANFDEITKNNSDPILTKN